MTEEHWCDIQLELAVPVLNLGILPRQNSHCCWWKMCLRALYRIKSCICSVAQAGISIVMTDTAPCACTIDMDLLAEARPKTRTRACLSQREFFLVLELCILSFVLPGFYLFVCLFVLFLGSVRRKSSFNLIIEKANSRVSWLNWKGMCTSSLNCCLTL